MYISFENVFVSCVHARAHAHAIIHLSHNTPACNLHTHHLRHFVLCALQLCTVTARDVSIQCDTSLHSLYCVCHMSASRHLPCVLTAVEKKSWVLFCRQLDVEQTCAQLVMEPCKLKFEVELCCLSLLRYGGINIAGFEFKDRPWHKAFYQY